jgi:IS30 family transposase
MPGKPFQSKLEPFLEQIRQWRCQRWSYPRIAEALHKEHGMAVAPSTIFSFVKVRAKGRKVFDLPSQETSSSLGHSTSRKSPAWLSTDIQIDPKAFFKPAPEQTYEPTKKPNQS